MTSKITKKETVTIIKVRSSKINPEHKSGYKTYQKKTLITFAGYLYTNFKDALKPLKFLVAAQYDNSCFQREML